MKTPLDFPPSEDALLHPKRPSPLHPIPVRGPTTTDKQASRMPSSTKSASSTKVTPFTKPCTVASSSSHSRSSSPSSEETGNTSILQRGWKTPKKGEWVLKPDHHFAVIKSFVLGDREIKPHYQPSYMPSCLPSRSIDKLYVCQWCFSYTAEADVHSNHSVFCTRRHPARLPGRIVYEKESVMIRKIDGATTDISEKLYLHNFLQLASCFIQTKALIMWTSTFDFYLLFRKPSFSGVGPWQGRKSVAWTEFGTYQCVGYNSHEKNSLAGFNLSCIVILPPWLKLGLFNLLAGLSYEESASEGRQEGPEAPISAAGRVAYDRLWDVKVARHILKADNLTQMTVDTIATSLGMKKEELLETLKRMGCVEGTAERQTRRAESPPTPTIGEDGKEVVIAPQPSAAPKKKEKPAAKAKSMPEGAVINKQKVVEYLRETYPPRVPLEGEEKRRKAEGERGGRRPSTRIKLEAPIDRRCVVRK